MSNVLSFVKRKKIYFIIGFIIILLIIGRGVLLKKPSTVLTYTTKQEDLIDTIQVSGIYKTSSQVPVTSPSNGVITKLFVENGDSVKKGDPLFHVESTSTIDQQKAAFANYKNSLSALSTAKNTKQSLDATMWTKKQAYLAAQNNQNYKNDNTTNPATKSDYTDLEKQQIDSSVVQTQKDFRAAEQSYKSADVAVNAAQAQVAQTLQDYNETQSITINAPTSGTINNLQDGIGDQVTATSSHDADTQPVLIIANLSNQYISSNIGEDYASRIHSGQKTNIIFDSLKDRSFTGIVSSVDTLGTSDLQGIVTFATRVEVDNLTPNIKPGMTALVTIETLHKNNVIDVPNSAIIYKNGKTYVSRVNSQKNSLIEITLGEHGMTKTEVASGLTPGTTILANPDLVQ